jgi:phenylpyruvate tautomerase PptA (4-oxalocrotonate tautomerase family)
LADGYKHTYQIGGVRGGSDGGLGGRRRIVKEITETMIRIAGTKPEDVRIIIVDHPRENLATGGSSSIIPH